MDQDRGRRIRESFAALAPRMGEIVPKFYERLTGETPELGPLFPRDMAAQHSHFATALTLIARHADDTSKLGTALRLMGARHAGYGVRAEHYPPAVAALVGALGDVAGPAWSPSLEADWRSTLEAIALSMVAGARDAAPRAAA